MMSFNTRTPPPLVSSKEKYCLNRDNEESKRLENQHEYLKRILNRKHPLPPTINPSSITTVLDVAAGCCSWILDLAGTPGIKERLCPPASSRITPIRSVGKPVELYACDMSNAQFPPQEILQKSGVTAFEHDVCNSFPSSLKGKFDLIHMRLVVFALDEDEWSRALMNLRELLKPGGIFLLVDLNMTWYNPMKPFPDDWRYTPTSPWDTRNTATWIDYFNDTMRRCLIERNRFVPDLVHRLPSLLSLAGWKVHSRIPFITPIGALCHQYPGPLGQNVAAEEEATIKITSAVYNAITRRILKVESSNSQSYGSDGSCFSMNTETKRQDFMEKLIYGMKREGALAVWVEILAT